MWAIRRASVSTFRSRGLNTTVFRAFTGLGSLDKSSDSKCTFMVDRLIIANTCQFAVHLPTHFLVSNRGLSHQAGGKSGGEEDDLDEKLSELEKPAASETTGGGDDAGITSLDSDGIAEDSLDSEVMEDADVDAGETVPKRNQSPLLKLIRNESGQSISGLLDNYFPKDKDVDRGEVYGVMWWLRKYNMYPRALQLSEWLEKREGFDFTERDYAFRVSLIATLHGLFKAEQYMESIPKSHRQQLVYGSFLAKCVSLTNKAKAEEIIKKMKDLGFPQSAFTCNQLLMLYKKIDKKKVADLLLMMEKENIKPDVITYELLADIKGLAYDIAGMEQIVEVMKAEGVKPTVRFQMILARHYAIGGYKEKAEAVLKEIEGDDLNSNLLVCPILLPIYAHLGNANDVERIWKVCAPNPREVDFLATIRAWGKLKNFEQAEAVFEIMSKSIKKLSPRHYSTMLEVYAENKMLSKGKQLLKQMIDSGYYVGPLAMDSLVKLYVNAGEVEKADSILHKATQQKLKPTFMSYMSILDQYAKRGDIHNAEKIFQRMRWAGYVTRARPFIALLEAYITAKVPAYGFRERMKADNVIPNEVIARQLAQTDSFRSATTISDLID